MISGFLDQHVSFLLASSQDAQRGIPEQKSSTGSSSCDLPAAADRRADGQIAFAGQP
jgi:hypothetical protein